MKKKLLKELLGIEPVQRKLNYDLINVNQWLKVNKLTLTEEKTEFMIIGSRQTVPSFDQGPLIKLGDKVIKRVPHKKTLGVVIDEQLISGINTSMNKVAQF